MVPDRGSFFMVVFFAVLFVFFKAVTFLISCNILIIYRSIFYISFHCRRGRDHYGRSYPGWSLFFVSAPLILRATLHCLKQLDVEYEHQEFPLKPVRAIQLFAL